MNTSPTKKPNSPKAIYHLSTKYKAIYTVKHVGTAAKYTLKWDKEKDVSLVP
jgi:hypothetical protein